MLLCARDLGRGQAARAAILAATPAHEARLHVLQLDVEDAASVAAAAASVERTYGALAGLCNNAGVAGGATAEVLGAAPAGGNVDAMTPPLTSPSPPFPPSPLQPPTCTA